MDLVEQNLELNYIYPEGEEPIKAGMAVDLEGDWFTAWLHHMVENHPEVNFFYTVCSTDVWEKAWDFNNVVMYVDGEPYHTYSPDCPGDCSGQLPGCIYKESWEGLVDAPEAPPSKSNHASGISVDLADGTRVNSPTPTWDGGDYEECPTAGCKGDARYSAPGRGHKSFCDYPYNTRIQHGKGTTPRDVELDIIRRRWWEFWK